VNWHNIYKLPVYLIKKLSFWQFIFYVSIINMFMWFGFYWIAETQFEKSICMIRSELSFISMLIGMLGTEK
jgi:uncharacterized protein involved in cysteine biosynthesis